jgi:hypothetical protein
LIRLCFTASWLQIQDFLDTFLREDMVAAANSLVKGEIAQQLAQVIEREIGSEVPRNTLSKVFSCLLT